MPQVEIRITSNFERNLEAIDGYFHEAGIPDAFGNLLDELNDTVMPNLEHFPGMGRPFLDRAVGSMEAANREDVMRKKLRIVSGELFEYIMTDYLVLYLRQDGVIHLLSIKHHRQLSFDFAGRW